MIIVAGDYALRSIEESDLEQLLVWRNSDRIRTKMLNQHIITMDEHRKWFDKISKYEKPQHFVSEYKGNKVGYCGILSYDLENNVCKNGFYIGEENAIPVNAMASFEYLLNYYTLNDIGVTQVDGEVLADNNVLVKYYLLLGGEVLYGEDYYIETGEGKKQVLKMKFDLKIKQRKLSRFISIKDKDINYDYYR